jgi:hydrolase family protein
MVEPNRDEVCCPEFQPEPWDGKEITWENKKFVSDRVRSFFHIPMNFGKVMVRNMALIQEADAAPEDVVVLADENSLWGSDVYISVDKDVPAAKMTNISGTFLSKVFEGPYKNMGQWIKEMGKYTEEKGKEQKKLYF